MIHFIESLREARRRTLALVGDLTDEQMIGPRLEIVNPLLWEIGHVAWFQEYWVLRHLNKRAPILPDGDALYDSAKVAHETRWDIPLLSRSKVLAYMQDVLDRVIHRYGAAEELDEDATYFLSLVLFHEDMHDEAFSYTRQTLGYPQPQFESGNNDSQQRAAFGDLGDALIPGGHFLLGSLPDQSFVFDNEMDAHEVELEPFSISRTTVSNAEFAAFVAEGGYEQPEFWSAAGWQWRQAADARQPVYWQRDGDKWLRRSFAASASSSLTDVSGCSHSKIICRSCMSIGMNPTPFAAGPNVACPLKLNGRWPRAPGQLPMAAAVNASEDFPGVMKLPIRIARTWIGKPAVASTFAPCPLVTVRLAAGR